MKSAKLYILSIEQEKLLRTRQTLLRPRESIQQYNELNKYIKQDGYYIYEFQNQ